MTKISDSHFWDILKKNAGLFENTAKAIQKETGQSYTRQSVEKRAKKDPERLHQIKESIGDAAESTMITLMKSKNESIRMKAAEYLLKRHKDRGFTEKTELSIIQEQPLFPENGNEDKDDTEVIE